MSSLLELALYKSSIYYYYYIMQATKMLTSVTICTPKL